MYLPNKNQHLALGMVQESECRYITSKQTDCQTLKFKWGPRSILNPRRVWFGLQRETRPVVGEAVAVRELSAES